MAGEFETLDLSNVASAGPNTAAGIANAGVNTVGKFLLPLAGPALGLIAAYWGLKTVIGQPPKFIQNIVGK